MSSFEINNCGHAQVNMRLHPEVEKWRRRRNREQKYPNSDELQEQTTFHLKPYTEVVDFIIGTDTTTGDVISLTSSGKLKAFYAFGWDAQNGDTGYDLTQVRVKFIDYGGGSYQDVAAAQNTISGTLDFTAYNGLHSGILTLWLKIIF